MAYLWWFEVSASGESTLKEVVMPFYRYFMDDKMLYHGEWKVYFDAENTKLSRVCEYHHSVQTGRYITYYENGQVSIKTFYKNDKVHGQYISYTHQGRKYRDSVIINDEFYSKTADLSGEDKIILMLKYDVKFFGDDE